MRILVTRPREDSQHLAQQLEARGHQVLIEPLFVIELEPDAPFDLDGVQALLMTSANGVRAFAAHSERRDLRVFAVGDATAEAARACGFADVESAAGDVDDLARLVRERARPGDGALLHAAGSAVAGDLAGALQASGFEARRVVLYRAEPVQALSSTALTALREGYIDLAVFFSPRTARTFVGLARAAGVERACARVGFLGLSPAVVEAAADVAWAVRESAAAPTEAALLDAVDRLAALHEHEPDRMNAPASPQPPPAEVTPAPPAATRERRSPSAVAVLALLVALAVAGWVSWRDFSPKADDATQRLAAVEQRSAALERDVGARLAAVDQIRGEGERRASTLNERLTALESKLAALTDTVNGFAARIGQVETEQKNDADPARLAMLMAENRRLGQELARLQEAVGALDATLGEKNELRRGESLVLALGQLREQMGRGAPYAGALATARSLAADDQTVLQQLAPLDATAERGVPTRTALRERFDRAAAEAVRSDRVAQTSGWWRPVAERLSSLVNWRRTDAVDGNTAEAIVARAEQRLAADDLAGAIAELEKLQGPAAAAMQGWLAEARARAAADAAVARLTAYVLRPGPTAQ
jgi:uroporphyrinogen-III synthase